ncbi:meiotic recombination protein REC8 homolog isoform X2 [Syngnathoides biaculeatus]|uniref:meiotic recombination protein REC8 homolog isoform X2 n=1 Tax=Syngnathoides biaculeatus TaxID=300417 RepID=UPI002ADE0E15|nr:meiotic recombination protein REC8 homolog isoform X2 [Syngnathoides biaculeatus]
MFYYPVVLKRGSGCFSTIWLAATRGITVPCREVLRVNVKQTCDDIMNYILELVPPPQPTLPRPRFSLYLSSQLQYGVVVVFHRQCVILLQELQLIVGKLLKHSGSNKLDMEDPGRQRLIKDTLTHMDETGLPLDPFFGVMDEFMPSPCTLTQMAESFEQLVSPPKPEPARTPSTSSRSSRITASPQSITIREPPAAFSVPEFVGQDLEDNMMDTVDFLLNQVDDSLQGAAPEAEIERARTPEKDPEPGKESTATTLEVDPTTMSSGEPSLLPLEGLMGIPHPLADQQTPVSAPQLSLPSLAAEPPTLMTKAAPHPEETDQKKKTRKTGRQLIFIDTEMQISNEEMDQQISDFAWETRENELPLSEMMRSRIAHEMLMEPSQVLVDELASEWQKSAKITPTAAPEVWPGDRDVESSGSEQERTMLEATEREEGGPEVAREAAESDALKMSGPGSPPLEVSNQREVSREVSPLDLSDQESSTSGARLQDIPERELLERTRDSLGPLMELDEEEDRDVLFHSLLPPNADRRKVSNIFQKLLVILATKKLLAEQLEPYGDIVIFLGNYQEQRLSL